MVKRHAEWSTQGFGFDPVAPDTGPFPRREFLEAIWNRAPVGELCLTETESALVPLVLGKSGLAWVGHPDLVDYRSPLGGGAADLIAEVLAKSATGLRYRFDSLPRRAAMVVNQGLEAAGLQARPEHHSVAARLVLPDSYEAYLEQIGKKERHEIRRKRRRFHEDHGTPTLTTTRGAGPGFEAFVEMHRNSGGTKGSFMTGGMEGLFASLAAQDGWRVDLLSGENGEPVAATFAWADVEGFYLYNSAFDREAPGSPGIVLLGMLIERAIQAKCRLFDFLKGEEPYKFRLGATPRPLFKFEGST
jgi:CelD/BcsL family acetyltransferase involved in cellulose biosynthesis